MSAHQMAKSGSRVRLRPIPPPPSVNGDVLCRPPALAAEHFPAFFSQVGSDI
jgi:hypothetical protein